MSTKKSISRKSAASEEVIPSDDYNSLLAQLKALYSEREKLHSELGVSDAESIITMIRSLTAQLEAFYQKNDEGEL